MSLDMISWQTAHGGDDKITYVGPNGQTWNIATPHHHERQHQPVMLLQGGTDGFSAKPETVRAATTQRSGEREIGRKHPAFAGTLKVVVGAPGLDLGAVDDAWRSSWEFFEEGKFVVANTARKNRVVDVRMTAMTDRPNNLARRHSYPCEVSWLALAGVWDGRTRQYTGEATVVHDGESGAGASAFLIWDTSTDAEVIFPHGQRLTLTRPSTPSGLRFIDLRPGMSGRPTLEHPETVDDPTVDVSLWAAFRGAVRGVDLKPHMPYRFNLTGVRLQVTPHHFTPWR